MLADSQNILSFKPKKKKKKKEFPHAKFWTKSCGNTGRGINPPGTTNKKKCPRSTHDDVELCVDVDQLPLVVHDGEGGDALRHELVQRLDDRGLRAGNLADRNRGGFFFLKLFFFFFLVGNPSESNIFNYFPLRTSILSKDPIPSSPIDWLR